MSKSTGNVVDPVDSALRRIVIARLAVSDERVDQNHGLGDRMIEESAPALAPSQIRHVNRAGGFRSFLIGAGEQVR